jgi:molybdopterin-guanine dinucleotide biosynthesis protein A
VLAGGSSRRLGGIPKGLEQVGGRRIIDRVADALRPVTSDLLLAANDPDARTWLSGARVVSDLHPGAGGMAGVEAALSEGRDVLVVAWDMPFVIPELLRAVVAAADATGADIALPESLSPHGCEPFCAFYSARVRAPLRQFLESGGGAAREFLGRVSRMHLIPLQEIASFGDLGQLFLSVNTPVDLSRARAIADATE